MRLRRLLWILIGLLATAPARAEEQLIDGIAAQVGSDIVLVSEVMQMVEPMEARLRKMGANEREIAKLRAEALERMIEWRLIEKVVGDAELSASETEIDEAIASIASENSLSTDQLRKSVESHGLSYEDYRAQIKREIERRKVINTMVRSQVHVDESAVRDLYVARYANQPVGGSEVRLRQILVTYGGDTGLDESNASALLRVAQQRVAKGEPFELVASDISQVAPEQGGDLGWLLEDSLAGWMRQVVAGLEPGQTSDVSVLDGACALLHLVEKRQYQTVTFEMAKAALSDEIFRDAMADRYADWLEKLRSQTFIERRGFFADAAKLNSASPYAAGDASDPSSIP